MPQAYSVHLPQAKEKRNNPLSSSLSTILYNVHGNNSKRRQVVHGQCTQSKKLKVVDPDLSLPEESDMDDMLQALSNEVEGLNEKGLPGKT